jgi:ArsR family transcriptional regulator, arsenate/arsenite/antimonite-responsive transcriptional repressor
VWSFGSYLTRQSRPQVDSAPKARAIVIRVSESRVPNAPKTRVDHMFRAFSDPTRLRILHLIRDGEVCVCDLVDVLRLPQPTVSRHLSYLRKAGLVSTREERSWNFYTLTPARTTFHRKLLDCLGACFNDVPELSADSERAKRLKARGGCCPH